VRLRTLQTEFSSVCHAHEEKPAALQTCAQRTLRRLCTNVMWFDLGPQFLKRELGVRSLPSSSKLRIDEVGVVIAFLRFQAFS
jgi:hypothetical protein